MESQSLQRPAHVAVVMDGNGRWASMRALPRVMGHEAGVRAVKRVVYACMARGVPVLTLFAFSCENWQRPQEEVNGLMQLFFSAVDTHLHELIAHGVRLRFVGDRSAFSPELQALMQRSELDSAQNTGLHLNLAMNYSGRWDILQACQRVVVAAQMDELKAQNLTSESFEQYLALADFPDPDLLIRTSGELRLSNFMLWQLAYTELFFTPVCWPDFSDEHLDEALGAYQKRQRRFGALQNAAAAESA